MGTGCSEDAATPVESPTGEPAPTTLDGTWISHTWGLGLVAHDGVLDTYEFSPLSCLPYATLSYDGLSVPELGGTAHFDHGQLLLDFYGTTELQAERAESLPALCAGGGTGASDDPELAFEVFWKTFDSMYSSFDLRHVDWRAQYDAYRPAITPATTPSALFGTLCEMVRPLDDPHVNVGLSDEEVCSSRALPSWFEGRQDAILAAHDEALGADGMQRAGGQLTYGTLRGRFGYVSIPSMSGFGDTPDTDQQTAEAAIDEVVAASAELDGMVVDVRFNDGGSDGIALALAARFADRKRFAFSVETRDGSGWTPRRDYYVQPAGERQFEKPVVLLTSALTVSAAEIFTLAMRTLPHVTVVGETTAGGHSTMTLRNLPNGFGFTLPFERVFAADGVCYEGVGLDPSLSVAFDPDAFVAGDDTMLTAALEVLEGG